MASAHPGAPAASDRPGQRVRRVAFGQVARYLGAAALVGVGVAHIWQYYVDSYSVIPTIGTLFALNFASALVVALGLVAPLRRLSRRWCRALLALLAVSGAGIALGSLAGLEVSETTGLFGFMEAGYRPAIVLSIALEGATVVFLIAFLVAGWCTGARTLPAAASRPASDVPDDARPAVRHGSIERGGQIIGSAPARRERRAVLPAIRVGWPAGVLHFAGAHLARAAAYVGRRMEPALRARSQRDGEQLGEPRHVGP